MTEFILVGAGGLGIEVAAVAALRPEALRCVGVVDDDPAAATTNLPGVPYLGNVGQYLARGRPGGFHLAIGDNGVRARLAARFEAAGHQGVSVVHPMTHVGPDVVIGAGSYLAPFVIVSPTAAIGTHVLLNSHAAVGHHAVVEPFAQVGPGGRVSGWCRIGREALIASNAVLVPGVEVGAGSIVGAGSVATRNVPADVTVFGLPARPIPR